MEFIGFFALVDFKHRDVVIVYVSVNDFFSLTLL